MTFIEWDSANNNGDQTVWVKSYDLGRITTVQFNLHLFINSPLGEAVN